MEKTLVTWINLDKQKKLKKENKCVVIKDNGDKFYTWKYIMHKYIYVAHISKEKNKVS